MLYFFLEKFKLYMFRVLFAPIIKSTTAVYSHKFSSVENRSGVEIYFM
jgi:hypothetical protein